MAHPLPEAYRFDPADPRAPSLEQWNAMSPEERARVVATLPAEVPLELQLPEGDPHWNAKVKARSTLDEFFRRIGRKIYVSSELAVFYPDTRASPASRPTCSRCSTLTRMNGTSGWWPRRARGSTS